MKLSEWAHAAEVIGGVAIVASLIFVGLEVRENTRVTQLTSDRAVDQQNVLLNTAVIQSPDFADILVKGEVDRSSLSAAELARFDNYALSRFGAYENLIGNYTNGFVSEAEMEVWNDHFIQRYEKPGYRQFWSEFRLAYFPDFRAWADERYSGPAN